MNAKTQTSKLLSGRWLIPIRKSIRLLLWRLLSESWLVPTSTSISYFFAKQHKRTKRSTAWTLTQKLELPAF